MKTIRMGVFETNSSSTHSLCILTKQEYQDWQDGKVVLDLYSAGVKPLNENKLITEIDGGCSYEYKGKSYDSMYDLLEDEYEDFDDSYAIAEYISEFAEVEQKELDDKVIMSIYRGDRW